MSAFASSTLRARCLKWRNVRKTLCVTMFFPVCVCLCWQISLQVFWGRRHPKKTISLMKTMILESRCLHVQRYALDVYVGPFRATHCVSPCFFSLSNALWARLLLRAWKLSYSENLCEKQYFLVRWPCELQGWASGWWNRGTDRRHGPKNEKIGRRAWHMRGNHKESLWLQCSPLPQFCNT